MYKWAVRWMIRRNVEALRRGDPGPLLAGYADDAVLVFPGSSSWGGEHRGKPAIEAFLRALPGGGHRRGHAMTSWSTGPPWRTTVCVLFSDQAARRRRQRSSTRTGPSCSARVVWGKIVYHEDFEDTHKVEAFDRVPGPTPARASADRGRAAAARRPVPRGGGWRRAP